MVTCSKFQFMYSCTGTEYSYRLDTLVLIISYFHSGTTFGKELKRKKENAHVLHNNVKVFNIFRKQN